MRKSAIVMPELLEGGLNNLNSIKKRFLHENEDEVDRKLKSYNTLRKQFDLLLKYGPWLQKFYGLNSMEKQLATLTDELCILFVKQQSKEHGKKGSIYESIRSGNLIEFKQYLNEHPEFDIVVWRDSAGATLIHAAYLYNSYDIGHYLVTHYPELGLIRYGRYHLPWDSTDVMMPYAGE